METRKSLGASEADLEVETGTDRGASIVEYALLISLIVLICIASITVFGDSTSEGISTAAVSMGN